MQRFFLALSLLCTSVHSEVLFGIQYNSTLGTLKEQYPKATFTNLNAAWVGPEDAFISMQGLGLNGELRVGLRDARPFWRNYKRDDAVVVLTRDSVIPSDADVDAFMESARRVSNYTDDDALNVRWVRWLPASPIELKKLESRYGKSSCSLSETFDTLCRWESKAVTAMMSSDGKSAVFIETNFTQEERDQGLDISIKRKLKK